MRRIFTHPKDQISPDSRSLQAGYPRRGGRHSSPEPKVRQRARFIGQHPRTKLPSSETSWPLSLRLGEVPDLTPPAHPNTRDLSQIRQEPTETVHHYWARFLLVMNRIEDCREEDAISFFCNNCTDIGILNTISRREITCFADLASIVRKYCATESVRKTEIKF